MNKLLIILLLLGLGIQAGAHGLEQEPRVSIAKTNVTIKSVLSEIEQQTGFTFFYNNQLVNVQQTVSPDIDRQELSDALALLFDTSPIAYRMIGKQIALYPKGSVPEETTEAEALAHVQAQVQKQAIERRPSDQPTETPQAGNVTTAPQSLRTVRGIVLDQEGVPLSGATMQIKENARKLTIADANGKFELTDIDPNATLVVSFISFETVEIPVEMEREMVIMMKLSTTALQDVVVTGYYNITRQSYTGAARTITLEELRSAGNQSVLTSLKNLDPSFVLVQNNAAGSDPNILPEFQIRGQSSFAGLREDYTGNPNMPLFVLDGFEVSVEKVFDLDIYRINTITILKDAAATAIYGSRAANGVVVITSVIPQTGRLYVTYNADLIFTAADLSVYDLLNASEKLNFEKASGMYNTVPLENLFLDDLYNTRLAYVERGYDTYWLNKPLNKLTVSHKHTLCVDGGSNNFRYSVNANYDDNRGVMKQSGRKREGIGMYFQYFLGNINVSNEISYSSMQSENSPYGDFSTYAMLNPYYRYMDDEDKYIVLFESDLINKWPGHSQHIVSQSNPLYNSTLKTKDHSTYEEFRNNFNLVWNVVRGLVIRGNISITKQTNTATLFKPAKHTDFASWTGDDFERRGLYRSQHGQSKTLETKIMSSYQTQFEKNVLTANGVWEMRDRGTSWELIEAEGFPNDNLNDLGSALQYAAGRVPQSSDIPRRLAGFFASVNYIYDNRYMVDLTGRMDASSEFGANKRWGDFWSAGVGWNLHQERFLKDKEFVNRMKLRASYGLTGSVDYDPAQALTSYRYLTGTSYHFGQGAALIGLGNPNLGWQQVHEGNIGLDLDVWNNRVQITANVYLKRAKDVLTAVTLPGSTGFSSYMANLGEIENRGFDISFRTDLIKDIENGVSLNLFGTATQNKNILKKLSNSLLAYNKSQDDYLDQPATGNESEGKKNRPRVRYIEGASINSIWANPSLGVDAGTGREIFLLPDGSTTEQWSSNNYVIGGCTDPKLLGTFGFNFQYKNFRLNGNFYYSFGGDIYNQTLVDKVQDADFRYNVDRRAATDRWMQPGDISRYTAIVETTLAPYGNAAARTKPTTRFIERNNYLELTSINASYEINPQSIRKVGLSQIRFTFYMNDVFRASTVRIERGISYPFARNFSFGIHTRF